MKTNKNSVLAKYIKFQFTLKGNGIVNFDSKEQLKMLSLDPNSLQHLQPRRGGKFDENTSYAKKNFYYDGDIMTYLLKISPECLRNAIFNQNVSPLIALSPDVLYSFISSPKAILRGYLFTESKSVSIKKSTAVTMTCAEQISGGLSNIEIKTRSGEKKSDLQESDTTLYNEETIGDITYLCEGIIDLEKLQFVSCDPLFDRMSFNPDMFDHYKKYLQASMKNFNSNVGFFQKSDATNCEIPEHGFMFSQENVNELVRYFFTLVHKNMKITRNGAYAKLDDLQYKVVTESIQRGVQEEKWTKLNTIDDINEVSFEYQPFYNEVDYDKYKKLREKIKDVEAEKAASKKAEEAVKKAERDAKKAIEKASKEEAKKSGEKVKA